MILSEVFNNIAKWSWITQNDEQAKAQFVIGEYQYYLVVDLDVYEKPPITWTAEFYMDHPDTLGLEITNTGRQFDVFATVSNIIQNFISKYNPQVLTFDAQEPSRIKLYRRLAGLWAGAGYTVTTSNGNRGGVTFTLTRK